MSQPASRTEFAVKVPRINDTKRYSILKFNGNLNVDTATWGNYQVVLEREDNKSTVLASAPTQDFGEGSEYGRAAREEARRKKYGRQSKTYRLDNQPWRLSLVDDEKRERKFRSMREGGVGGHADYWVFLKSGENEFHAYKVDDWHQFLPAITHKVLDIDQAEEQFLQRAKVMNQFALKAQIQKQLANEEEGEQMEKGSRLKIKDDFSDTDEESGKEDDESVAEKVKDKKNRKKKQKNAEQKEKRDKRVRVKDSDDVAKYESEDGEDDGQEFDYMSDSGSDTDRDDEPVEEKIEKALVGVDDEEGLKKMMDSDEEDEEEDDNTKKAPNENNRKKTSMVDIEERDSSGSDTDDPDQEKIDSVLLLPKKAPTIGKSDNTSAKRRAIEDAVAGVEAKKAKIDKTGAPASGSASEEQYGLNEATVRKYLQRKPHTTKELVSKFKSKCPDIDKSDIVARLAQILKQIVPHQFRGRQGNKEVLFFSLQNRV